MFVKFRFCDNPTKAGNKFTIAGLRNSWLQITCQIIVDMKSVYVNMHHFVKNARSAGLGHRQKMETIAAASCRIRFNNYRLKRHKCIVLTWRTSYRFSFGRDAARKRCPDHALPRGWTMLIAVLARFWLFHH